MASQRKLRRNPWGEPATTDPCAKANQPHLPRSRKDRKRWCKGRVGVEHQYEVTLQHHYENSPIYHGCKWVPQFVSRTFEGELIVKDWRYQCRHARRCTDCGRYEEDSWTGLPWEECPIHEQHPKPVTTDTRWKPKLALRVARK